MNTRKNCPFGSFILNSREPIKNIKYIEKYVKAKIPCGPPEKISMTKPCPKANRAVLADP
jgi:hypothetical protein